MIAEMLAAVCAVTSDPAAQGIYAARAAFNRAIAEKDLDAIGGVLTDSALLVTGTDSIQFRGRDAQIEIWREDFVDKGRLLYERTPACVTLSRLYPIAMEAGAWRGAPEAGGGDFLAGRYSAKWRLIDGKWKIEAETYLTMSCGGSLCPQAKGAANP